MSKLYDMIGLDKLENFMEKIGFKAGKTTNLAAKIFIILTVGLLVGLLIAAYALSRGFTQGFKNKRR